jgi:hypothetical protein
MPATASTRQTPKGQVRTRASECRFPNRTSPFHRPADVDLLASRTAARQNTVPARPSLTSATGRDSKGSRVLRQHAVWAWRLAPCVIGIDDFKTTASSHMPRSELRDMLQRFRRVWQYQNQRLIHRLRWHHPGTVWAADHVQPDRPVDSKYPYILSVRDLASHYQLAWEPVADVGSDTTTAVLSSLFWNHGPPLVLKTDNGPGFIARDTRKMLAAWSILHLRNPPRTPQYNGSCEATGGSQKNTTDDQAALAGHPRRWTYEDLQRARNIRNRLGRPWGHRGPTPEEAWRQRLVTATQRRQLQATVNRYKKEELAQRGIPDEALLSDAAQASIDRVAISRALRQHGYLRVMRRLVTPPVRPGSTA